MLMSLKKKLGPALLLIVIGLLLCANIAFLYLANSDSPTGATVILSSFRYLFVISVYLSVIVALWNEAHRVWEFHLDRFSIVAIIIMGTFFRSRLGIPGETYYLIAIWILDITLLILTVRNWSVIPGTDSRWSRIGLVVACLALVPLALIETLQPQVYSNVDYSSYGPLLSAVRSILYNLSFVSLYEEVIFRGFLWGYLARIGWNDYRVLWGQAIIFWLLHSARLYTPVSFFITIPIGTLIFTLLAHRSKQLYPSIIAHTLINSIVPILAFFFTQ
jgi:membrane protease YdiL (CAAX protease family)